MNPLIIARATQGTTELQSSGEMFARPAGAQGAGLRENLLRLYLTTTVRGRVTSSLDAHPLAGVRVALLGRPNDALSALMSPVTTGADGCFEWKGVPGTFQLYAEATHPDFGVGWTPIGSRRDRIGADAPQLYDNLEISMSPLVVVSGRINFGTQQKAATLPPMTVGAVYAEGEAGVGRGYASTRVNADGTFSLRTAVGPNTFSARGVGYRPDRENPSAIIDVKPDNNPQVLLSVQPEKGYLVHFSTPLAKRNPNFNFDAEFDLYMRGKDGKEVGTNWGEWWYHPLYDPNDTLEIRITRFADGFSQEVVPWTRLTPRSEGAIDAQNWPREIVLPLRQKANVRGRVLNPDTGAPVPGATVSLVSKPAEVAEKIAPVTSGPDGSFAFTGLPLVTELKVQAHLPAGNPTGLSTAMPAWTRVAGATLSAQTTTGDEGVQNFNDIVVSLRPLRKVTFQFIDSQSQQPALVPGYFVLGFNVYPQRPKPKPARRPKTAEEEVQDERDDAEAALQKSEDILRPEFSGVGESAKQTLDLPDGKIKLTMSGFYELEPDSTEFTVSEKTSSFVVKVRRRPALMLHLLHNEPTYKGRVKYWFEPATGATQGEPPDALTNLWSKEKGLWLVAEVPNWGFKQRLVVIDYASKAQLFAAEVEADPQCWPKEIRVAAPK